MALDLAFPSGIDSLLSSVRAAPLPSTLPPEQIGIDDWAKRKGQTYATIIVDLTTRSQSTCCRSAPPRALLRGYRLVESQPRIVEAIVYQMQRGCAWNALPKHFPPYQTVHTQLRAWQKSGILANVWEGLKYPLP